MGGGLVGGPASRRQVGRPLGDNALRAQLLCDVHAKGLREHRAYDDVGRPLRITLRAAGGGPAAGREERRAPDLRVELRIVACDPEFGSSQNSPPDPEGKPYSAAV